MTNKENRSFSNVGIPGDLGRTICPGQDEEFEDWLRSKDWSEDLKNEHRHLFKCYDGVYIANGQFQYLDWDD